VSSRVNENVDSQIQMSDLLARPGPWTCWGEGKGTGKISPLKRVSSKDVTQDLKASFLIRLL
jgi:hypothetical protein